MAESECVDSIGAVGCCVDRSRRDDGVAHLRISQRTLQLPGNRRTVDNGSLVRVDRYQRRGKADSARSPVDPDNPPAVAHIGADFQLLPVCVLGAPIAMEETTGGQ